MRMRSTPVLLAAALTAALTGCTAAPSPDGPAPAAPRPTPSRIAAPEPIEDPAPVASDPVEFGTGDVTLSTDGGPAVGRLTFTDLGPAGRTIRLTGFDELDGDIQLVLLDEFTPKPHCLPDVFHTSSWQPDLVPDGTGAHVARIPLRGDAMGDHSEFPHAMMMESDPVDADGVAGSGALFQERVAAGCMFPVLAEAEMTWTARR